MTKEFDPRSLLPENQPASPAHQMVFVAHHVTGVRLIPQAWLDGFRPSGFREATPREIAGWYEDRDLPLPAEPRPISSLEDTGLQPPASPKLPEIK